MRTGTVGRYMKVILIERAIEILLGTTSTYQSEGSCSQGNSGVAGNASKAVEQFVTGETVGTRDIDIMEV